MYNLLILAGKKKKNKKKITQRKQKKKRARNITKYNILENLMHELIMNSMCARHESGKQIFKNSS